MGFDIWFAKQLVHWVKKNKKVTSSLSEIIDVNLILEYIYRLPSVVKMWQKAIMLPSTFPSDTDRISTCSLGK
jgi:hypothetical protein